MKLLSAANLADGSWPGIVWPNPTSVIQPLSGEGLIDKYQAVLGGPTAIPAAETSDGSLPAAPYASVSPSANNTHSPSIHRPSTLIGTSTKSYLDCLTKPS